MSLAPVQDIAHDRVQTASQDIIDVVLACHTTLSSLPNLEPGVTVNGLFGKLVSICLSQVDTSVEHEVLSSPAIQAILPSLQAICSEGEGLLEHYWASKLTAIATESG
jgi:hypothetical protein